MPYIPQFNKLSLQEMSYAPSLLRQQHDDAVAKQMELAEALKFDYLKQDAPGIEPVLQQYNTDIEDVSKQIAQQGFTQDIKNKVLGLRSKFVTDDKIRQYKKNYSDAMTGWEDLKKRMIQEGRPGDDINKQKAAYFSGYKGAFDDEGFKQEFTAGRTSGYYDIAEDAKKAMTGIGETGVVVGNSGTKIELKNDLPGGGSYFRVTDTKTGQYVDNKDQRAAVAEYLKNEYGNPSTDRGLFAQISGLNQADIYSTIDNVSRSMAENRYAQLPQTDTNISGMSRGSSGSGSDSYLSYLQNSGPSLWPKSVSEYGNQMFKEAGDKLAKEQAKKLGIPGVESFDDLKKLTNEGLQVAEGYKYRGPSFPAGYLNVAESPYYKKAVEAMNNITTSLANKGEGTGLASYNINTLMLASNKSINEATGIREGFEKEIERYKSDLIPLDGSKKDIDDLSNLRILDIVPSFKKDAAGIAMVVEGTDSDKNTKELRVALNPSQIKKEAQLVSFLRQLNPIIGYEYDYAKYGEKFLESLSSQLNTLSPEGKNAAVQFLQSKINQ